MRFLSVCSGIEAASVAWSGLGWEATAFAEIDPFARAVLAHRFPETPNLGDFTQIGDEVGAVELLVGGTPCQDFSVAGLRAGLDGERGHLTIEFVRLLERTRPRWVVWENVPGVLSIDGGRAFGAFIGALGKLGYGFAYRVLDAQHFGVPQRRRRVFAVGYLGDWRPSAAVLFERESLRGDSAPSGRARQIASALTAHGVGGGGGADDNSGQANYLIAVPALHPRPKNWADVPLVPEIAHTLRGEGFDASEDGTGRGIPLVPLGGVRRLTPVECERLMGFPDCWTAVPYRGKPAADGPRYRALGNSMAVPVMRWIGERIALVESLL